MIVRVLVVLLLFASFNVSIGMVSSEIAAGDATIHGTDRFARFGEDFRI